MDDDDGFDWPNIAVEKPKEKINAFKVPTLPQSHIDKEPKTTKPLNSLNINNNFNATNITQSYSVPTTSQTNTNRKEKAFECQIQFLKKRLDKLKEDNTKLESELETSKSKIVVKDGEV